VVDYAHTPDALRRAIKSVRETGAANVITVFGCVRLQHLTGLGSLI
jgi:UDP-N-acetylmuramyl tripeptide synthase